MENIAIVTVAYNRVKSLSRLLNYYYAQILIMHLSLSVLIKAILMKLNDMPMILFGHMVKKKLLLTKKIWDYVNIYFLLDNY